MSTLQAKYRLATGSGYKSHIARIGHNSYDPLALQNKSNFPDLLLTRTDIPTDYQLLHDTSLFTINGLIYPSEMSEEKLYIPKATDNLLKSRSNHTGIHTFQTPLRRTAITPGMITPDGDFPLYKKAILTFPHEVETAFLSLAGYLVFEQPEFFYRVSPNSFVIRLDRLDYIDRLYELNRYRNIFDELQIENSPNNPSMLDADVVRSNVVVERFLSLFNSFLVEVPNYDLTVSRVYLEHSNVPGNFRTEVEPLLPLVSGRGKLTEYLSIKKNNHKYTVHTTDAYQNNLILSKLSTPMINRYNDHREPGRTYQLSQAFFLDIRLTPLD